MPLPIAARDYLLKALSGTPYVLEALLKEVDDSVWDKRPDPERFTLREVLAHLADWEPIWLERVTRIANDDRPFLPSVDESALAVENDYAASSPAESIQRYREGRSALIAYLSTLPDEAWDRTCDREFVGILNLQQQAFFALAHDGYHMKQVAEWTQAVA